MSLFQFDVEEILTFFAVLTRYSVLFSILPITGDRVIPAPVKILISLAVTFTLFPALVNLGHIHPKEAAVWASSASGIVGTIILEVLFGLILGYSAKIIFDGIAIGANLVGHHMGFASASIYDPHQETQTQVIAQLQTTIALLMFLSVEGHHHMLRASIDSYRIVGLGKMGFTAAFSTRIIEMTGSILHLAMRISGPVALSIFAVHVAFGLISKAIPQLNVLVLSFGVTALVGFFVLFVSLDGFGSAVASVFEGVGPWMDSMSLSLRSGG